MRGLFVVATLLTASSAFAEPVHLAVKLPAGSVWLIEANFTREKSSSTGSSTAQGRAVYRAELRRDGEDRRLVVAPQPTAASQMPSPIVVEYEVDDSLMPKRIANWDELQRAFVEGAEKSDLPANMIEQARAMYAETSAEAAANQMIAVLPWIAEGQDTNLEPGRASPSKGAAVSRIPAGNADVAFTLVSMDAAAGQAIVTSSIRTPSQPFTEDLRARFRQMVESTNPKASKELPDKTGELSRSCRFEIDVATGLARRVECDTVGWNLFVNGAGSGVERQTEHWIITQTLQARP